MSLTIDQILGIVRQHRPMSRAQLFRYIKAMELQPVGARQRPQRYSADAADRVLAHLGLVSMAKPGRVLSMKQLQAVKRQRRAA